MTTKGDSIDSNSVSINSSNTTKKICSGITELNSKVYPFSILYPFYADNDIHRFLYFFEVQPDGSTTLMQPRYSELSTRVKAEYRAAANSKRLYFYLTLSFLIFSYFLPQIFFFAAIFTVTILTIYEAIDRRIIYLWLKREYNRSHIYAKASTSERSEED